MSKVFSGQTERGLWVWLLAAGMSLSACGLVPHYQRPDLDLPPAAQVADPGGERAQYAAMQGWWRQFQDPVLNQLVDEALTGNLDIALQAAHIQEARAQLSLTQSVFYPDFNIGLSGSRTHNAQATGSGGQGGAAGPNRSYNLSASLGYELNLFAALAAQDVADAGLRASVEAQRATRLAVVGEVVASYLSLRDLQQRIRLIEASIASREQDQQLAEVQFEHGVIGKFELLQRRALLASLQDQLPSLRQQIARLESVLDLLSGKSARDIMAPQPLAAGELAAVPLTLPPALPELLPAALINRRPDIRAAEEVLIAADASVSIARAQYLPSFNLTALIGSRSSQLSDLLSSGTRQSSVATSLAGPFFSLGRIQAGVASAEARREQALLMYRQTVQEAFKEVRDALVDVGATAERVASGQKEVDAYAETLRLARLQHEAGRIGLQDLLDTERQLHAAQLKFSGTQRERLQAAATLFRALGGGWLDEEGEG